MGSKPYWIPSGTEAVPERYGRNFVTVLKRYRGRYYRSQAVLPLKVPQRYRNLFCGTNQRRTPERYHGAVLVGVAVLPLLVPVVPA